MNPADRVVATVQRLQDELEAERKLRRELQAALETVCDRHSYQGTGEPWPDTLRQARAALDCAHEHDNVAS